MIKKYSGSKINRFYRLLRNTGILCVIFGILFLVFACGNYVFRNTSVDFLNLDEHDSLKNFIGVYIPIIGSILFISGVILLSKFQSDDEIHF